MGVSRAILLRAPPILPLRHPRRPRFYAVKSGLEQPDVARLAETARISVTLEEVEDFAPKIRQVVDWFGQLQTVDLQSIAPALGAGTAGDNLRIDEAEVFSNRESMLSAVPTYEEPYIKVPRVLNKD